MTSTVEPGQRPPSRHRVSIAAAAVGVLAFAGAAGVTSALSTDPTTTSATTTTAAVSLIPSTVKATTTTLSERVRPIVLSALSNTLATVCEQAQSWDVDRVGRIFTFRVHMAGVQPHEEQIDVVEHGTTLLTLPVQSDRPYTVTLPVRGQLKITSHSSPETTTTSVTTTSSADGGGSSSTAAPTPKSTGSPGLSFPPTSDGPSGGGKSAGSLSAVVQLCGSSR